ncbi:UDP-N-acetylglucosamine--N-acetylmuramyl-(pentapeptide) pyrophosphoryl-undecaprenol N-acetylglucosamine transferase [Bergeyella porcorum]|uniref:UDP-N-acetylglucosamine--N-acetylmuramyl-(Pentapeptide) pyrophosphoryl-undecaprenol N-acetylglucosamine transferase n=1 Tax=Bergeyella porcorum TaxID=1735111 RepID=A0AAU0EZZ8_9FLAO
MALRVDQPCCSFADGRAYFYSRTKFLARKTNLFLAKKAKAVFTAYPDMEKFFAGAKTFFLGNPIRENIITDRVDTALAKEKLGLDKDKLTILSVGGHWVQKTLNDAWSRYLPQLAEKDIQLIWQTGRPLPPKGGKIPTNGAVSSSDIPPLGDRGLVAEFISDMPLAYSAADVIVSRAGAIAISELSVAQKPILLVPFPFAAEDHQTQNALTLVNKNAAKMVKDVEMKEKFWTTLMEICESETLRKEMCENLGYFAKPNATKEIVDEILKVMNI